MKEPDILEIIFSTPTWGKIGQAQGSLNVYENLVNFFTIWSIMEVNNCCMLGKTTYLEKFWFLRYEAKC